MAYRSRGGRGRGVPQQEHGGSGQIGRGSGFPLESGRGQFNGGRGRGRGNTESGEGFRGRGERFRGRGEGFRGRPDRGMGGRGFPERGHQEGRGFRGSGGRGSFRGRGSGYEGPSEQAGIFGVDAPIDARLSDGSQQRLINALQDEEPVETDHPFRPDLGVLGEPIKLRANFLPISIQERPLYEYDVKITPDPKRRGARVRRRIFELAEETPDWLQHGLLSTVAHDYAQKLISVKELSQPLDIKVPYLDDHNSGGQVTEYLLTITFSRVIDIQALSNHLSGNPEFRSYDEILPIITALNIVLSAHPSRPNSNGVMVGRNKFYSTVFAPVNLGGGLEAWKGFYSSVRTTHRQLMVNVNVCNHAFYKPMNLADAIHEVSQTNSVPLDLFVRGLRVKVVRGSSITQRTVKGLTRQNAQHHKLNYNGREETVDRYYLLEYNTQLAHATLPLLLLHDSEDVLPPEICEILPNQPYRLFLSDTQAATMIKVAAKPPNANASAITNQGLTELGFRSENGTRVPVLDAFDISVGTEMAVVPGRILPAPGVQYLRGAKAKVDSNKGSWNLRDVKFAKGASLEDWAVLIIRDGKDWEFGGTDDPALRVVIKGFAGMCRKSGMKVAQKDPTFLEVKLPAKSPRDPIRTEAAFAIKHALSGLQPKPNMVLVVLSDGDRHVYSGLKHVCDSYVDVATICVHASKIRQERGQPQYFANVALKMNMKLGGVNHLLDEDNMESLLREQTMLVGIDVTHSTSGTESVKWTPSIAAVVANIDNDFGQFPASMRIQKSRKEMVTDLAIMMKERLVVYKEHNNKLPERIIVYRDGVSESQFSIVRREELPEIKKSFGEFDLPGKPYTPRLTIVICGKRHHTRFYPMDEKNADTKFNPKPGTVVDQGITSVYNFDFFLQSHGGLQGSTRPTHYYVVHDENHFLADGIQGLTNAVSHMFARATKAVSLVSPAYYADLACERGRCYLHSLLTGKHSLKGCEKSEENVMQNAKEMWHDGVAGPRLKETMFYL